MIEKPTNTNTRGIVGNTSTRTVQAESINNLFIAN